MLRLKDKNIFIFSPESWGANFISKHHFALELAKNNSVWFFNPPRPSVLPLKIKQNSLNSSLNVVNYEYLKGANSLPARLRRIVSSIVARRISSGLNTKPEVVFNFDPYVFQDLEVFEYAYKIFFSVDIHETDLEFDAASSADLVLCTSRAIKQKLDDYGITTHNIGHGVADLYFQMNGRVTGPGSRLKVGYAGNLAIKTIDLNVLQKIIEENPDLDFHFAGASGNSNLGKGVQNLDTIRNISNVEFLGQLSQDELSHFLRSMDILLMCYDSHLYKEKVSNSHKILEYLASGNPVVTNYTMEYDHSDNPLLMVKENSELPQLLKRVSSNIDAYNSSLQRLARIKFAKERLYSKQLERIENLMSK